MAQIVVSESRRVGSDVAGYDERAARWLRRATNALIVAESRDQVVTSR